MVRFGNEFNGVFNNGVSKKMSLNNQISFFNSLALKKEKFIPNDENNIKIYACGPTIYKSPHIGNFRSFVVFDVLFRFLSSKYPKVTYVRNITDIDDKIIHEAKVRNIAYSDLTAEVYENFKSDSVKLNILNPTYEPRATDYIKNMIRDIEKLVENGFAYVKDNHVIFDTTKYDKYRDFCKNMCSESGSRIALTDLKKHENDFVLWKPSSDVFWDSPWGNGRPGWHIECTSMSKEILGFPFDIHCGGQDLIFPHHTNERAQGWGLCNKECATYWMHNHFVNIDNNKMSKSANNQFDLAFLTKNYDPMAIRIFLLMSHYRHPLNWSESGLKEASNIYAKWKKNLFDVIPLDKENALYKRDLDNVNDSNTDAQNKLYDSFSDNEASAIDASGQGSSDGSKGNDDNKLNSDNEDGIEILDSVSDALSDDLNTPLAIKKISEAIKIGHNMQNILKSCAILGITFVNKENSNDQNGNVSSLDLDLINSLVQKREIARKNKDYNKSDEIRDELTKIGIKLEDTKDGVKWYEG
ncbi:cysteine--tRNA ligase [Candidatus Cytomitobacter primus]|uniref:Cysteine--tRNA ligase n=1 Tax=Candidatus Cytomitobacter primus TaxID=2066024 RepID=A0A5C0UFA7_9PROT|nr:cysteine--tRNA ligase [Candidatus Cytomitobacter primus]QEK38400.1 cysteine--tRNA ligase [Candidatus Cytomitobacter primus]